MHQSIGFGKPEVYQWDVKTALASIIIVSQMVCFMKNGEHDAIL